MGNASAPVKRILVVEDEPAICNLCRRVLTEDGFEVDITSDGEAAQEKIAKQQYNLLFMDIRLPKMGGIELYEWLQAKHPQLANRVAFTTGSVIGGETLAFLQDSERPRLFKPFGCDELKAFIGEVLGRIEK
jgi:DNA-binding response OmpR family regulator